MIIGCWTFNPSSKDVDGDEGVAKDMESSVGGTGLLARGGERGEWCRGY